MRHVELADNLKLWAERGADPDGPVMRTARLVLAAFDECPDCRGEGWVDWPPPESECFACGGAGVLLSKAGRRTGGRWGAYLFGGDG